jgi:hypothetical protein
MNRGLPLAYSALLGALTLTAQLHAQSAWTVSVGAAGAREIVHSRLGTAQTRLSGSLFSGEAVATRRRFVARLRYGQGHVTSDTAASDVVQGEVLVGYKARPWLHVWLGPRARTFVAPGFSDRRWLFWSGGLSARGGIFPGRVDSFVELWQSFSGRLNRPASSASGSGVELGLEARLAKHPWRLRFAYRIEQGRVDDGRRDTVEGFTLTAGYVAVR